jgi:ATP-dependent protease ClpP protease subunit
MSRWWLPLSLLILASNVHAQFDDEAVAAARAKLEAKQRAKAATLPSTLPATRPIENRYIVIPIKGVIGADVTPNGVKKALEVATASSAKFIVLDIDTAGGAIADEMQIVAYLTDHTKQRRVAFVRKALSAGAVIALSCQEIVMSPRGHIGAAVPLTFGSARELPADEAEKLRSADHAYLRAVAEAGGRDPLYVLCWRDIDATVNLLVTDDGKRLLLDRNDVGEPIKRPGEIVTWTATEAQHVGLSSGTAHDVKEIGAVLRLDHWRELRPADIEQIAKTEAFKKGKADYLKAVAPTVAKIDAKLAEVRAEKRALEATLRDLQRQFQTEVKAARRQYGEDLRKPPASAPRWEHERYEDAKYQFDQDVRDLEAAYQPQAIAVRAAMHQWAAEEDRLLAERERVLTYRP